MLALAFSQVDVKKGVNEITLLSFNLNCLAPGAALLAGGRTHMTSKQRIDEFVMQIATMPKKSVLPPARRPQSTVWPCTHRDSSSHPQLPVCGTAAPGSQALAGSQPLWKGSCLSAFFSCT